MEKVTADTILNALKTMVESRKIISKDQWLETAFSLNLVRIDEAKLLHSMEQAVAKKKLGILQAQEKKNVALAEVEIESSEEYRFARDQEAKLWSVDEFIRIAKKNSENSF